MTGKTKYEKKENVLGRIMKDINMWGKWPKLL